MKNYLLSMLFLVSSFPIYTEFEDKPAVSQWVIAVRKLSGGSGATVGMLGGALGGMSAGGYLGSGIAAIKEDPNKATSFAVGGLVLGFAAGAAAGATLGYKTGNAAVIAALARYHRVSYRVEKISQFYNINLEQYGALLIAADKKADDLYLTKMMNDIFSERFGQNWKERLALLYVAYRNAPHIFTSDRNYLSHDELDFIRMIKVGAAVNNLYFKTTPRSKHMFNDATVMYQKLGLL